jgi:hypothetical protein
MWETRTRLVFRASVLAQIMKEAKDNEDVFYAKDFRRLHGFQVVQQQVPAEEEGLDESLMQEFFDDPASPLVAGLPLTVATMGSEHCAGYILGIKTLVLAAP